nr:zinc finger protein 329-like [Dermacentor andersoni]
MIGLFRELTRFENLHHVIYADDVTMWVANGSKGQIEHTLQNAIRTTEEYLKPTGLWCSPSKSELLIYRRKRRSPKLKGWDTGANLCVRPYTAEGNTIPVVGRMKMLGTTIEASGSNTIAVTKVTTKAENATCLLRRVANRNYGLKEGNLLRLAQAFVISHFVYIAAIDKWFKVERDKLDTLQRKVAKRAMGLTMHRSTEALDALGVYSSGSPSQQHLGPTSSINPTKPSTSRTGMLEASESLLYGARNPQSTRVHQRNTQYHPTEGTSTVYGYAHNTETRSTDITLPAYSSTGGGNHAVASTSHAGTQEASGIPGNDARFCEAALRYQRNTQHTPMADETCYVHGATDNDSTSCQHLGSVRSIDNLRPSTSRAGKEKAAASFEDGTTNAPGTGGREQRELCGVCGNVSSRPNALHGHAKEHTDDTTQICRACDQSSVKMSKSVEHFRNRTSKKHKCETCGKHFHWAHDLTQHQRTHTDERPYKCEICEKSFRQSGHLYDHQRTHTGEKPYICKTCGKTYTRPANLRKHEHTHAEENRHACQKCAKSFENKYHLKRHVDSQCGNKAFICEVCDRFFMSNSNLLRHRRTKHVDETPYECTQSGYRFADKETRDRHACQK